MTAHRRHHGRPALAAKPGPRPAPVELDLGATPVAFVDDGLGNSSYLIQVGDRAAVVDPSRHPGDYLAEADRRGLSIAFAVETHLHADFVSGARELAALGASVLAPAGGGHAFPVQGLCHGDEVDLAGLTLRALATPGHTPEHLAYLLLDGTRPLALFSGGSLLVQSVARTDLVSPDRTEELARSLWQSLRERILTLPDELPVFPTHGAGSFCTTAAVGGRSTTIGSERAANPLLAAPDEDTFVKRLIDGLGSYPPYFLRLREVNRAGPRVYGPAPPVLARIRPDDVARLGRAGAWVVDLRPVGDFARRHVPGSVSIPLRPQFGSWLGWVVPDGTPLVFVLGAGQDRAEALRQARNVGYEEVLGELAGGMDAWAAAHAAASVPSAPAGSADGTVIDVRQRDEFRSGHLPGAINVELGELSGTALPSGPLAVMCGHGERAVTAASLLARAGRRHVTVLTGGPDEWSRAHGPLVTGP